MHCHLERVVTPADIGRIYQSGLSYANRDPYTASFVLLWHSDHQPEICAIDKPLTKQEMRAIRDRLLESSAETFLLERHGKLRLRSLRK